MIECYYKWCKYHEAQYYPEHIAEPFCNRDDKCVASLSEIKEFEKLRQQELSAYSQKIEGSKMNDDEQFVSKEPSYTVEPLFRVYNDLNGSYIQIGKDRKWEGYVEFLTVDHGSEISRFSMPKEQFEKFLAACVDYADMVL